MGVGEKRIVRHHEISYKMGVSKERKRDHKFAMIGEGKRKLPDSMDYNKIRKLKQRLPKGQKTLV